MDRGIHGTGADRALGELVEAGRWRDQRPDIHASRARAWRPTLYSRGSRSSTSHRHIDFQPVGSLADLIDILEAVGVAGGRMAM